MTAPLEFLADNDDQHRELAQGAVQIALRELENSAAGHYDATMATADVVLEAECAWMGTGLVHESYSQRDIREVCAAIVGQVAVVLVKVGWQPPARLLEPEVTQ